MKITKIKSFLAVVATTAITFGAGSAFAGIIGDNVNVTYYYPSSSSVYQNLGNQVISSAGNTYSFYPYFDLVITDSQFTVNFKNTTRWNPASFNGFVVTDLTKNFSGAYSLDGSSNMAGLTNANLSFGGNTVAVNWQGLAFSQATKVVLDAAVPEPTSVALLGLGLFGVVASRRKSTQSKNA